MLLVDFSSFASMSIMAPFFPQQVSCSAKNLSHIAQLALYEGSCGTSFWGVQLAFFSIRIGYPEDSYRTSLLTIP